MAFDPNTAVMEFDPSTATEEGSIKPKKKNAYVEGLKTWATTPTGLGERVKEQMVTNVAAPTTLGGDQPGSLRDIYGGIPERATRFTLGTLGSAADVVGTGVSSVAGGINALAGGIPGEVISAPIEAYMGSPMAKGLGSLGGSFAQTGAGKGLYQMTNPEDPAERANMAATGSGLKFLTTLGTPATKPAVGLMEKGIRTTGEAAEKSAVNMAKGFVSGEKGVERHVDAMLASGLPQKVLNDLGPDPLVQKAKLTEIINKHGIDRILGEKNKDMVQSKILNKGWQVSREGEDQLMALKDAASPENIQRISSIPGVNVNPNKLRSIEMNIPTPDQQAYMTALTKGIPNVASPKVATLNYGKDIELNPWRVAEDAIAAERAKGTTGAFSGVHKAQLERVYKVLQKDWAKEWYKQRSLEDVIKFKRDVLNPNNDLYSKATAISVPESAEKTLKKIVYKAVNEKLGEISPEYLVKQRDAKDIINLSKVVKKYAPPMSGEGTAKILSNVGMAGGTWLGGTLGGPIPGVAGAVIGRNLGDLAGKPFIGPVRTAPRFAKREIPTKGVK